MSNLASLKRPNGFSKEEWESLKVTLELAEVQSRRELTKKQIDDIVQHHVFRKKKDLRTEHAERDNLRNYLNVAAENYNAVESEFDNIEEAESESIDEDLVAKYCVGEEERINVITIGTYIKTRR